MMRNRIIVPYQAVYPQRGVNRPQQRMRGLGALGGNTTTIGTGAAQGAAVGTTIFPGIGTAVGAVVGAIAGIFGGTSNPQIQIDKTNAINLFSQYQAIAGTVSGRSIGYENMDLIFRGACFMGHFPGWNNETELPDSLMSIPGSPYGQNDNCFAVLWAAAQQGVPAPGSSGKYTGNGGVPVRDAKTFVDKYVWPSNSSNVDTDPWATNTDAVGQQVIYDAADAYIATQSAGTTPYIPNPQAAATPSNPIAATAPVTAVVTVSTPSLSPSGTSLVLGQIGGVLVTPQGTWTVNSAGQFLLGQSVTSDAPTQTSPGVVGLLYQGQQTYAYETDGTTYIWNGTTWQQAQAPSPSAPILAELQHYASIPAAAPSPSSAVNAAANALPVPPSPPTVLESADGSEVTSPGTAVETPSGTVLYLGPQASGNSCNASGYPIWETASPGATPLQKGYAVGLLIANAGNVYAVNAQGIWYKWASGSGTWQMLPSAPSLNSATPTTSTVASPQSGVTSSPGAAPLTTGAVVGTTATGDTVTDTDLQDLIDQMSAQGATATQTYQAVLSALQEAGTPVTPTLQSQVAGQVSASVPTPVAASSGSDTGIMIVGGGLALLGLLYFMGRKAS